MPSAQRLKGGAVDETKRTERWSRMHKILEPGGQWGQIAAEGGAGAEGGVH